MISNTYLKILSVVIAIFLWFIVVMGQIETKSLTVPVTLINAPKGYVAVASVPNVSVRVSGAAKVLASMNYSSVMLQIDVNSLPIGDSSRQIILENDFKTPIGVEVIEVEPKEFIVTIDQIDTKKIRVAPAFIGDTAHGFKVESVSVKPDLVEIEGARSKLKDISFISTLPVNMSGVKESSVFSIGFSAEEGVKSINPDSVEVRVRMRPDIITKNLKDVPILCMDLIGGLSLKGTPKLSSVRVTGRSDLVDNFLSVSTFVVNCSQITKPGVYSGAVAYRTTSDGVEVESISPQKINFEIE